MSLTGPESIRRMYNEGIDLPGLIPEVAGLDVDKFICDAEIVILSFSIGEKLEQIGEVLLLWERNGLSAGDLGHMFMSLSDPLDVLREMCLDCCDNPALLYFSLLRHESLGVALEGFYLACDAVCANLRNLSSDSISDQQISQLITVFHLYYDAWREIFEVAKMIARNHRATSLLPADLPT